jgi:hypothetical protein
VRRLRDILGFNLSGETVPVAGATNFTSETLGPDREALALRREIDQVVLGLGRDADHAFLPGTRQRVLYRRGVATRSATVTCWSAGSGWSQTSPPG